MPFRNRTQRHLAIVVTGLVWGLLASAGYSQKGDDAAALNIEVVKLYQLGKYGEAIEIAKRLLTVLEMARGPEHHVVGASLSNLAFLFKSQGRYAEAEPLLQAQPRHCREGDGA